MEKSTCVCMRAKIWLFADIFSKTHDFESLKAIYWNLIVSTFSLRVLNRFWIFKIFSIDISLESYIYFISIGLVKIGLLASSLLNFFDVHGIYVLKYYSPTKSSLIVKLHYKFEKLTLFVIVLKFIITIWKIVKLMII